MVNSLNMSVFLCCCKLAVALCVYKVISRFYANTFPSTLPGSLDYGSR